MFFYRVENGDGEGPYRCEAPTPNFNRRPTVCKRHPVPSDDTLLVDNFYKRTKMSIYSCDSWLFGFTDLDQLTFWFTEKDRKALEKDGFKVSVYRLKKRFVVTGKAQSLMHIDACIGKRTKLLNINTLERIK